MVFMPVIDIPCGVQAFEFDCGPKSLQLVLAYYGIDVREDELLQKLKTDNNGTRVGNMVDVARSYGFDVATRENTALADIRHYVDSKTPVIVLVQAWADSYMTLPQWRENNENGHYVVVVGYTGKSIHFEDPAHFSRTWLSLPEFMARWHDRDPDTGRILRRFTMVLSGLPPAERCPAHMD
jgi:ABC-type bacteriocin/lantibiotic exporter with double-glycine peptidase domain